MPTAGVVVPAFRPDVDRLATYVRALDERLAPAALLIELDDPRPGTVEALSGLPAALDVVPYRRGKGAAITAGFEALGTDLLAFADADGSTPAAAVAAVLEPLRTGRADVAVGSRRHPAATVETHQTRARRRLGDVFAWLARRLLDTHLHDYQCGAKAVTADAWREVRRHLYEAGFAWDVEFVAMAAALDYHIKEVPVTWYDHSASTVSPVRTALSMGRGLLVARHRASRLQEKRLYDVLPERGTTALIDRDRDPDGERAPETSGRSSDRGEKSR